MTIITPWALGEMVHTVELLRGSSARSVRFNLEGRIGWQCPLFGKSRTDSSGEDILCRPEGSNSKHLSLQFWLGHLVLCTQTWYFPSYLSCRTMHGHGHKHRRFGLVCFCSNTVPSTLSHVRMQQLYVVWEKVLKRSLWRCKKVLSRFSLHLSKEIRL